MDMFDVVKAGLGAASGAGGGNNQAVLNAVLSLLTSHGGGLEGLVQAFHKQGLGDVIGSWVGTGQNLPISADQLQQVLGSGVLSQFATHAGVTPDRAGATLAQMLPQVIDKLTPNGQVPAGNALPGLDILSQFLK